MSSLKSLASQTIWYGLSNIAARFVGYLLTPIITYLLADTKGQEAYGEFSVLYAGISLVNVLFTYGMETAYFRFAAQKEDQENLFRTTFGTLLLSTIGLSILFIIFRQPIANLIGLENHAEYIIWAILIIAFDTLSAIPFAKLRQEGRPKKYAAIKISGIILNVILTVVFLYFVQLNVDKNPNSELAIWYRSNSKSGLLLLANMAQSILTFLLLMREWKGFRWSIDKELLRKLWVYGSPMIIVGLGGMVNETMDRIMLLKMFNGSESAAKIAVGIYGANYRIAIFITLFIQAFKMSAEPFFFKQAAEKNAPATYAMVMKWFVITLCIAFLFSSLFLDIWRYMTPKTYWSGLKVVPILLFANVCLGIYYNLLVVYKITDNMRKATYITLIGSAITLLINLIFIPQYGMIACAWATAICYFIMMLLGYFWGQKYFPIPYPIAQILQHIGLMLLLYSIQFAIQHASESMLLHLLSGVLLFGVYFIFLFKKEKNSLGKLPFVGAFIQKI